MEGDKSRRIQAKVAFHNNWRGTDVSLGAKITPGNMNPGEVREGNQTVGSGTSVSPGGTLCSHFVKRAEYCPHLVSNTFIFNHTVAQKANNSEAMSLREDSSTGAIGFCL